ncbi:acetyl-CoA synthetase-like protein [Anaeromyces robustus]|uniref:Acetyl-CoA synthetase-like protein n=1 Tax=Anaeromyces robustus TaxID=1754192 RepID=A0A1Y1WZT7_9FUNG|nr:acetyl-CoA synthetase-like protein [Anaeromyces robustus]|eukprot:ORX78993.1 acetyl-CoA synthetase-like protein [Anaeromyces robustus]
MGMGILLKRNEDIQPRMDKEELKEQMIKKEENGCNIYRSKSTPLDDRNTTRYGSDTYTLYEIFQNGKKKGGDYLGYRKNGEGPYIFYTYEEIALKMTYIGSGYIKMFGLKSPTPEQQGQDGVEPLIGIMMKNCPEWLMILWANICYSFATVPVYETFCQKAARYILNITELSILNTKLEYLKQITETITCTGEEDLTDNDKDPNEPLSLKTKNLKYIVLCDQDLPYKEGTFDIDYEKLPETGKLKNIKHFYKTLIDLGIEIVSLRKVEEAGKNDQKPHVPPVPETLYMICFTSGTTGNPKGALLTHKNFTTNSCSAANDLIPPFFELSNKDCHISYLPLSHTLEQIVCFVITYLGCRIGFYSGNVMNIVDDIAVLQPSIFITVPRLLTRVYAAIKSAVEKSSNISQTLFNFAYQRKLKLLKSGYCHNQTVWDKLVFSKVQNKFGGNLRAIIVGSAPLDEEIITFLRVTLGCFVLEGYGATETCAVATLSIWNDYLYPYGSHVGVPLSCNELRIDPIPETEFVPNEKTDCEYGEICFRSRTIMKGYFKNPEETKKCIDENGWFHTGDIGKILPNRTVQIIGRKKFIFKLAQGEYVSPEHIENVYCMSTLVAQCCVVGHTYASCLVGIVIPDFEELRKKLKRKSLDSLESLVDEESKSKVSLSTSLLNVSDLTDKEICEIEKVKNIILDDIRAIGKEENLKGFEQVKDIALIADEFTNENGLLTPSDKNCRPAIKNVYKDLYNDLFNKLGQNTKGNIL